MIRLLLLFTLFATLFFTGCSQQQAATGQRGPDKGTLSGSGLEATVSTSVEILEVDIEKVKAELQNSWKEFKPPRKVSRFELDDRGFQITGVVIGYKDYLQSQTPYLIFDAPPQADYVQIMRCTRAANFATGLDNISISDIELSAGSSPIEKANLFRENDIWGIASSTQGCEIINLAYIGPDYLDSWAPSGSYRYFVRACMAEENLLDQDKTTSRFCSRQVAISQPLEDFVNKRQDVTNVAIKEAEERKTALNQAGVAWFNLVKEYGAAVKECEEREFRRAVSVAKKKAIVTLVAAGVGMMYEASTWKGSKGWKAYTMNFIQFSGEAGGMTFGPILQDLTVGSEDMPRTCAKSLRLDAEVSAQTKEMRRLLDEFDYYDSKIASGEALQQAMAKPKPDPKAPDPKAPAPPAEKEKEP